MNKIDTILAIRLGDEYYGIDSDNISQVLRVPAITPIPLTADSLNGVVVLNGKIIPVIDMKQVLDIGKVQINSQESRIITIHVNSEEIAILVDEVIDAVNVDDKNYEENTADDNFIIGFYKHEENLIQIVEPKEIIADDIVETFAPAEIELLADDRDKQELSSVNTNRYLFFKANSEFFAVDIELVAELIFVPNEITAIAGMNKASLGAITLREEVIEVFDFNMLFGFERVDLSLPTARILILRDEGKKLAFCVEYVEEIKDIDTSKIESSSVDEENRIEALYKDTNNIVSIVSKMFVKELIDKYSVAQDEKSHAIEDGSEDMRELAVFGIGQEEFAFDIENVQEIITYQEVTPVPDSNEFIKGVINLRGAIIAVVDLPKKLGFESQITDKSKIIVCTWEGEKVGFLVDDVNDIMFIEEQFVAYSKSHDSLTKATISLENGKRVILELRIDKIVDIEELQNIKKEDV
ncbi:MAG: hypothetical protein GXO40_03140 [Epsilonproteobacteria bacterium]|nr:hypothetical protein [Campylobacterota bacterium]